jgi:signal transduction histidine kinase
LVLAVNATRIDGGVQLTARDISEAKRAEEAQRVLEQRLRRSERMEAFGQLAGGVSHDFNNILTGLLGHLELTRYRLEDLSVEDAALHQSLAAVERSAERGAALTKQLLQFSRHRDVDEGKTDLAQAVGESEKLLRPLIREDVVLKLNAESSGSVGISGSAVGQIVMNLVINACDAMTQGGTVYLRTSQQEVLASSLGRGELPPGRYVLLEVEDTGSGISETVLPRIFEPFFTTKPAGVGTGLGLSTVHGIVRRAGGQIQVSSAQHRGTTFRIYLPQLSGAPTPQAGTPTSGRPRMGKQELVLVCEDESTIRDVISEVLTQHGFRVYATGSPRAALEEARKFGPELALVISDVIMPELNGPQLVTELKTTLPDLRVLYISGYTAGLLKDLGIRDDDARFLSKPFSPSTLLERVHALLSAPS